MALGPSNELCVTLFPSNPCIDLSFPRPGFAAFIAGGAGVSLLTMAALRDDS